MATKERAKSKARRATSKRPAARKRAAGQRRRSVAKPARAAKKAPRPRPPIATPAGSTPGPVSAPPPGEEPVGVVTHYYNHLSVATVKLESGLLRVGDTVHIKGHTSDFRQRVESLELDHVHVNEVWPGQRFGLKVIDHAREHDVVYRVVGG